MGSGGVDGVEEVLLDGGGRGDFLGGGFGFRAGGCVGFVVGGWGWKVLGIAGRRGRTAEEVLQLFLGFAGVFETEASAETGEDATRFAFQRRFRTWLR